MSQPGKYYRRRGKRERLILNLLLIGGPIAVVAEWAPGESTSPSWKSCKSRNLFRIAHCIDQTFVLAAVVDNARRVGLGPESGAALAHGHFSPGLVGSSDLDHLLQTQDAQSYGCWVGFPEHARRQFDRCRAASFEHPFGTILRRGGH